MNMGHEYGTTNMGHEYGTTILRHEYGTTNMEPRIWDHEYGT